MSEHKGNKRGIGRAATATGLAVLLAATPSVAGCGSSGGGPSEISGSANPSGGGEDGKKRDDGKVATAIEEIDEGDVGASPDDAPEAASLSPEDAELASPDIAGRWQCSVCVSGGNAVKAQGVLSNDLFLALEADGTGTLSTGDDAGSSVPLTWERGDGESAYIRCDEGSGNAAVTRSGRLKWHLDGNGEDSYTLWDSRSPAAGEEPAK